MKKFKILKFISVLSVMTSLIACNAELTVDKTPFGKSLQDNKAATKDTSENQNTSKFKVATITSDLGNEADQTVTISFDNGYVDSDTENLAKIKFFSIADSTANTVFTRTQIVPKSSYVTNDDGGSVVYLFLDLNVATMSSTIDIEIDPTITADSGYKLLNEDGDGFPGEVDDDIYYNTQNVTQRHATLTTTTPTIGNAYVAPDTFTFTIEKNVDYDITGTAPGTLTNYTKEGLLGGFIAEQFDYTTLTWAAVTPTTSYDNTSGLFTIDMPTADAGSAFRYSYKKNLITETTTTTGYLNKVSRDNALGYEDPVYYMIDNIAGDYFDGASPSLTVVSNSIEDGINSILVTFVGHTGNINDDSITNDNLKVYSDNVYVPFTSMVKKSDSNYILYFDQNIQGFGVSGNVIKVRTYPTITTDNATVDDLTDDRHFGILTNTLGVIVGTLSY